MLYQKAKRLADSAASRIQLTYLGRSATSTTTMKAAPSATCNATTGVASSATGIARSASVRVGTRPVVSAAIISTTVAIRAMSVVTVRTVPAVIPGTSTNEHASRKPLRAVVAIRRARVRVI